MGNKPENMEFINFFRNETERLYKDWREKRVEVVKHNGQEWLLVTGLDKDGQRKAAEPIFFKPSYETISEQFNKARREGEFNNRLAPRIGLYPPELSNIISPSSTKKDYQCAMVNCFLENPWIPNAEAANNELKKVRQSCLYLDSYDLRINQRNYIICNVLDYAAAQTAQGRQDDRNWVLFLQDVLTCFDLPLTWRPPRKEREAFLRNRKPFEPTQEEQTLLEQWQTGLSRITARDYTLFRAYLKEKYAPAGMSVSRYSHMLHGRILQFAPYAFSERTVNTFFAGNMDAEQNKCTREGVIDIAIAMGCTLEEINRLLQDINEPVLYPRSSWPEERQYVDWIVRHPYI